MVRHQYPGPDFDPGRRGIFGEQVAVERIIPVVEEGPGTAVAALGHMVRMTGEDGAGEAGHGGARLAQASAASQFR
jgi:hypothetical protein